MGVELQGIEEEVVMLVKAVARVRVEGEAKIGAMGVVAKEVWLVEKKVVAAALADVGGLREVVAVVARVKLGKLGFLACEDK